MALYKSMYIYSEATFVIECTSLKTSQKEYSRPGKDAENRNQNDKRDGIPSLGGKTTLFDLETRRLMGDTVEEYIIRHAIEKVDRENFSSSPLTLELEAP